MTDPHGRTAKSLSLEKAVQNLPTDYVTHVMGKEIISKEVALNIVKLKNMEIVVAKADKKVKPKFPESGVDLIKYSFVFKSKTFKVYDYIVFGERDNSYASSINNRLLFFERRDEQLIWSRMLFNKKYSRPKTITLTCDLAKLLEVVEKADLDNNEHLIFYVDTFWDLLRTVGLDFPKRYDKLVTAIINHFTFRKSVADFCVKEKYTRKFIQDGMLKIQETVLQNAVVYQAETDTYIDMQEYISRLKVSGTQYSRGVE